MFYLHSHSLSPPRVFSFYWCVKVSLYLNFAALFQIDVKIIEPFDETCSRLNGDDDDDDDAPVVGGMILQNVELAQHGVVHKVHLTLYLVIDDDDKDHSCYLVTIYNIL